MERKKNTITMNNAVVVKITIWGIVQGVGFRPFAAKLANRMGIQGQVCNSGGLVEIIVKSSREQVKAFIEALKAEKPLPAEIVHIKTEELPDREMKGFVIVHSQNGDDEAALIPADLAFCPDCLREMQDPENPRYLHPFISCMACGPRYTIIDRIPYDRENTAMIDFPMCDFCGSEYTDGKDRRFHAQTISCHDCGPVLEYRLAEGVSVSGIGFGLEKGVVSPQIQKQVLQPLEIAEQLIKSGQIIAVKGVGGYNFLCDPKNENAVKTLRKLKGREEKPFAVMFPDMQEIARVCEVSEAEEKLLTSSARPIVLLKKKGEPFCFDTCRTSRYVGAFLPSMGVQWLLLKACGPLIVTSANKSDFPMIRQDEEMFSFLEQEEKQMAAEGKASRLAGIFYNRREIRVSADDSVVRVIDGSPQMIRRSKGYAPVPLYVKGGKAGENNGMIFAAGSELKNSFALSKGPFVYISQYFGDLDSGKIFYNYEQNIGRMSDLFRIHPDFAVCDLHPLYHSTKYAEDYAEKKDIPLLRVQHHHAHVASVMAEHDLTGPVIGVSFDGTGYGTDGAVWGSEFLVCEGAVFERAAHLEYIEMLGGDSSMKEGWKSALCYLHHHGMDSSRAEAPLVYAALDRKINTIRSSSMGRLFDAVSAFLGIQEYNRYEGECAVRLENAAAEALEEGREPMDLRLDLIEDGDKLLLSTKSLFEDLKKAVSIPTAALGFHYAVAEAIAEVCLRIGKKKNIQRVALTGGTFQNKILMEQSLKRLREEGFEPYYNISVSPNDGGICLGQTYLAAMYRQSGKEGEISHLR